MPSKRRRSRRNKRKLCNALTTVTAAEAWYTPPSTVPEQTTECVVCHRSDQSVLGPSWHGKCATCMKDTGVPHANNLRCPPCPDQSVPSKMSVVIGKVKNVWLSATSSEQAESTVQPCDIHTAQTLEFLCQECEVLVCPLCKLAEHEGHATRSLRLAVADAKRRVADASSTRLRDFEERLHAAWRETQKRGETFRQTRKEVAQTIHDRHAQLTAIIDKYRDSALLELEALAVDAESCLEEDERRLEAELKLLSDLEGRIDHSMGDTDILSVDKEIQSDWSHDKIMVRRALAFPSYSYRLEHNSEYVTTSDFHSKSMAFKLGGAAATVNEFEKPVDRFIGHPVMKTTPLPKVSLDVKVTPVFRCCDHTGAHVLSVCPTGPEKVAVSYSISSDHQHGVTKSFYQDGRPSKSFDFGLCTLRGKGNGFFAPVTYHSIRKFGTSLRGMVSKSESKLLIHQDRHWFFLPFFQLPYPFSMIYSRGLPGSLSPQSCDVVAPLNFDSTREGDVMAFVDLKNCHASPLENHLKDRDRVVKLMSVSGGFTFTDVYQPSLPDFIPSDVCFFCLNDRTVLLVSDMGTSSIHVLGIRPVGIGDRVFKRCQFERYLLADHDLLKHPTALNTDEKGRLWVACRGGQLLTVEMVQ